MAQINDEKFGVIQWAIRYLSRGTAGLQTVASKHSDDLEGYEADKGAAFFTRTTAKISWAFISCGTDTGDVAAAASV